MSDHTVPAHVLIPAPADPVEVGLQALLASDLRFALIGSHAGDLLAQAHDLQPELVVFDPQSDEHLDAERIAALASAIPEGHVCLYTNFSECQGLIDALRAGARGYLLKRERRSPGELLDFLSSVAHGNLGIDAAIMTQILRTESETLVAVVLPADLQLGEREQAVVAALLAGQTEPQIAEALALSLRTVRRTIDDKLLPKFHARNLRELLIKAALLGRGR